jgi:hypothetical protein
MLCRTLWVAIARQEETTEAYNLKRVQERLKSPELEELECITKSCGRDKEHEKAEVELKGKGCR